MSGIELVLSDRRGIYIPQNFAEAYRSYGCWHGAKDEDIEILLAGPDHEWYWEAWDSVLGCAYFIDPRDRRWYLSQDGDLWMYNEELMTDEEYESFFDCPRERSHGPYETDLWYDTSAELT